MRDPFKVFGSIIAVTILCLIAPSAPQAENEESGEIIETDFFSALAFPSGDDQASQDSSSNVPSIERSLQAVPDDLIGDRAPTISRRERDGSRGRDTAGAGRDSALRDGGADGGPDGGNSDGGNSGGGNSGGEGSGGGNSGAGNSGDGNSGDGNSGGGNSGDVGRNDRDGDRDDRGGDD